MQEIKSALANVLFIAGSTDSGKTTVAGLLGQRHGWQVYNYDRHDYAQHQLLALTSGYYRAFLDASLDERWVQTNPEQLLERALQSFVDRWPLVVGQLMALPREPLIVAEGFGFTPDLLTPLLTDPSQAIVLVPTEGFKRASMERRNKAAWRVETSDPDRALDNLFRRDLLLAAHLRTRAQHHGLRVFEVDGSQPAEQIASIVDHHFAGHLEAISEQVAQPV